MAMGAIHPERMAKTRFWHPCQGAKAIFATCPVVALRLPPANLSNRFAVKHTDYLFLRNLTIPATDSTRTSFVVESVFLPHLFLRE